VRFTRRAALGALAAFLPSAARARIYPDAVDRVGESLDEIRAKGRLKVAVYDDFAPFSAARDGRLAGIDCDIARLLAEKLGLRLELSSVQAGDTVEDDLRHHVWRGRLVDRSVVNLMLHVPYSRELEIRSELTVLVQPYYTESFAVAFDPFRLEGEASLAALAGSTVGVELDGLPAVYLGSILGGRLREGLVHYRRPEDGLDALLRGEIMAFMGLRSQVEAGLGSERERFDLESIPLPGLTAATWAVGAAVRENARDLGYAAGDILAGAVRDGTMAAIFAVHGISYHPPPFA
jgi:polar amino acid transport system substrate-binding protein